MGAVYEAWDPQLERRVALKVLHPHLSAGADNKRRLLREARLAARLEHPGVVRVYGIHELEGGLALEMQYVVGTPLQHLLAGQPLSPVQAADLLEQVLETLAACHAERIVHSDLKPGNLLVTPEGKVLLTDFGIARAMQANHGVSATTLSGPLWGTPQYSPPEAWEGEQPAPSWDLYALGVLAHEALTGSLPFNATTPAVLMREKLSRPHVSIAYQRQDLSPELAGLIDALKATDAASRPADANAALALLRRTPEYATSASQTRSLRHTKLAARVVPSPEDDASPQDRITLVRSSAELMLARRSWKTHAVWLVILLASVGAALWAGRPAAIPEAAIGEALGDVGQVAGLMVTEGHAYFSFDDGVRGRELWCAKESGEATIVADINPGPGSSNPRHLLMRPGRGILFSAFTPEYGEEPWYMNPNTAVWMVKDIAPGMMSSEPFPVGAWEWTFLFYATSLRHGTEPWVTRARAQQTGLLQDLCAGGSGSTRIPPKVCVDAAGAYIVGQSVEGWRLWRYDAEEETLREVAEVIEAVGEMVSFGDAIFLALPHEEYGTELWIHRPGEYGVELFADLWAGPMSSDPQQFFVWNDVLYFQAASSAYGRELWRSDGTVTGTALFYNTFDGASDGLPYGFVATPHLLFFRATGLEHGEELWVTDGTVEGTRLVVDLRPGPDGSHPYNIVPLGDHLFFSAHDGAHGEELWALDLNAIDAPPRLVRDLWPGPESAEPHDLTPLNETTGIFVHKTPEGDALMKITVDDGAFHLEPFRGLR